jgi:predicted transglutaminase-like cysteine proteinase
LLHCPEAGNKKRDNAPSQEYRNVVIKKRKKRLPGPMNTEKLRDIRPKSLPGFSGALLLLCCLIFFPPGCLPKNTGDAGLLPTPSHRTAIADFPEWERVLQKERDFPSFGEAGLALWRAPHAGNWLRLRARLRHAPLVQQAVEVNAFFNAWPHREDRDAWGQEELWATPLEFVNHSGDCEDYVIAKYFALRDLGVPAEKLRIVGVWNREKKEGHGVLFVYDQAVPYVLDNATPHVRPAGLVNDYTPKYLVNEEYLWLHGPGMSAAQSRR